MRLARPDELLELSVADLLFLYLACGGRRRLDESRPRNGVSKIDSAHWLINRYLLQAVCA
jgi:hypothetical protein